ncbi:hypothetical protein GQ457_01G023360 [Hibiscus cannabinus]
MTRNNPQGPILPLNSDIDRLFRRRRREHRATATMYGGDEPVDGQQPQPDGENAGAIQAAHFELKPVMFNMLNSIGQFGGSPHEDARQHIRAFLEVCDSFRQQGVHADVLKLKLFPYSLRDRARGWLSGVPAGSLESWTDLCRSFLMRYNPPNMHTQLRNDIASFRQGDDESMYECWDRYKGLLRKCTNHGFQDWTQVVMFYNGVNAPTRMMLDASANGTLLDKSPEEAFEILDRIANNDYQFPTSRLGSGRRTSGKLELDANDAVSAQLSAITNLLKNLQKPSDVRDAKALSCNHCEGNHHATDCPVMHEQASYLGNYNRNSNNPYSNNYDPGWRQHPNFSWNNQGNNGQDQIDEQDPPRQDPPTPAGRAIVPPIPQNNQQQPIRTVCDYLAEDLEGLNLAVTIPEFEAEDFELKPVMFNMLNTLGQFGGSPTENARQHLNSILEIYNSFKIHGVSNDVLKLT